MNAGHHPGTENPTKMFYDRISKVYDLLADSNEHTAREKGLELLAVKPGERVLELGFGTGHSLAALARAVGPTGKVSGIDISGGMLEVATQRVTEEGVLDRVELRVGDARALPYADGQFQAVSMSFTLELFEPADIPAVLKEIRRVLQPGGRLGVVSMLLEEHPNLMVDLYLWLHRHFPHFIDCQPIQVVSLLQQAGFQIDQVVTMKIWSLPVAAVVAR